MADPWERMEGETARKYSYFCAYRDLGPTRTRRQVAERLGKSLRTLEHDCTRYDWVARARAWDDEQDRIARLEHQEILKETRIRHVQHARKMQERAIERLGRLGLDEMAAADVTRMLEAGLRAERAALGIVESTVKIDAEVKHELRDPRGELARLLDRIATRVGAGGVASEPEPGGS